jgi:TonB family protein
MELKDNNRRGRICGGLAAAAYCAMLVLLFLLITFRFDHPSVDRGIMIDFGDGRTGFGAGDTPLSGDSEPFAQRSPAPDDNAMATQDVEPAPAVMTSPPRPQQPVPQPRQQPAQHPQQPRQQAASSTEQTQRIADQASLFPGRTAGSASASEGTSGGAGNQGSPQGTLGGSHDGTGGGGTSGTADVPGRDVIGELPKPAYPSNERGRVVVDITVDRGGAVVSAVFRAHGSTTQDPQLKAEALKAARKARFTSSYSDEPQRGTITYNFRLK